jgi:hypothetical protein
MRLCTVRQVRARVGGQFMVPKGPIDPHPGETDNAPEVGIVARPDGETRIVRQRHVAEYSVPYSQSQSGLSCRKLARRPPESPTIATQSLPLAATSCAQTGVVSGAVKFWIRVLAVAGHGAEDARQFVRAGDQGDLLGFACREQTR